jgi:FMN phosphatase YigB (HAD superfamily)
VPAQRCLFVGDNPEADIAGAQHVGIHTALLARPGARWSMAGPAPDLRLESLLELLDHLPRRRP